MHMNKWLYSEFFCSLICSRISDLIS
jgi:hypothetical protein